MENEELLSNVFNSFKNALIERDVEKLDKIISDEYIGFSLHGTIETKRDILNNFKPNGVEITKYLVEDVKYETVNSIGLVTGKGIISGKYQAFEFNHIVLFTDIFKLVEGIWKYYKSQVTEIRSA